MTLEILITWFLDKNIKVLCLVTSSKINFDGDESDVDNQTLNCYTHPHHDHEASCSSLRRCLLWQLSPLEWTPLAFDERRTRTVTLVVAVTRRSRPKEEVGPLRGASRGELPGCSLKEWSSLHYSVDWNGHSIDDDDDQVVVLLQGGFEFDSGAMPLLVHDTHLFWKGTPKTMGVAAAPQGCFLCSWTFFLVEQRSSSPQLPC